MTVSVPAYAKINLFLDVHSVRENGYHNIISIMQCVSLCDNITVSYTPDTAKSVFVHCDSANIPCNESNLAYKAAMIFPASGKIAVKIDKKIPVSAGLAGGSTDAAATLVALNKLTGEKLSVDELCSIGAKLGADVPFCIRGSACLVEGIGEILTPIPSMPRFPLVIAKMGEGMSTPLAYKALDLKFNNFLEYTPSVDKLKILRSSDIDPESFCEGLYNVFETVVEPERPFVTKIKNIMAANNSCGAIMSGSGTSVFGIFKNTETAHKAKEELLNLGAEAFVCFPI